MLLCWLAVSTMLQFSAARCGGEFVSAIMRLDERSGGGSET
jgi:hypothetical protein